MTASLIDGRAKAAEIKAILKKEITELKIHPVLATVLVGDDPASKIYLNLKKKACDEIGVTSIHHELSSDTSEGDVLSLIEKLNDDSSVHGILVQLPLPAGFNQYRILSAIEPGKDVDGFHPLNIGRLAHGDEAMAPATPKGIIALLEDAVDIEGKNIVIINHSNVVGKPLALMLLARNATVSVCHVYTKDLTSHTKNADVVITAVGVPNLVKKDMVKDGAIIIDAGITKTSEGIAGDADFEEVAKKAFAITPVPGGVGPMTIAMLLANTVLAAKKK